MPNYGAYAKRVPATGGAVLADVDIYKLALLAKTERGIVDSDGLPIVHSEIYSFSDFYKKCGGHNTSYYGAYVAESFFKELESNISCELKVLSYLDASAVQATYEMLDDDSDKIFDVKAGRKGKNDKSAFGNKIGIKVTQIATLEMKISSGIGTTATTATLNSVDSLDVGHYITFTEGSNVETRALTAVNDSTKAVTFAALSGGTGFTASGTTVNREDVKIEVATKDNGGSYQKQEEWEEAFTEADTTGIAGVINDVISGSDYIILAVDATNTSDPEDITPAALTTWTALTGGADGSAAADSDWDSLATTYFGDEEFSIMLAPEGTSITHNNNMVDFCTDGYKGLYYCQSSNGASADTLKNFGASMRGGIKFGMIPSDKWIGVDDPLRRGQLKDIPKVGIDAAFWFNTYSKFGESKVAAGNKPEMILKSSDKLRDSNGLVHDDRTGAGGRMIRNYSVNICRYKRGRGITNNSARTLSTDAGYRYQNQIMQWILYSRSIVAFLKQIEQDKAGATTMLSHRASVESYMRKKYNAGHLFVGQKEDGSFTGFTDVCIVINDFTINTLVNISNGIEEIFLQFVAPPPIEEAILSLASASVTTVKG
ncbi:MAG: hypothetical protein GY853_01860 [PVC group bacterium]|nr:hypothetical protein [PVC group bacterium]